MIQATCKATPSLFVPALGVQFRDGVAEVDESTARALAAYACHGVEVPEPSPARRKTTKK